MRADRLRRAVAAAAAAAMVTVLAGACSGGGESGSTTTTDSPITTFPDPDQACKVLTKAELEATIASPVGDGQGANGLACRYDLVSGADQAVVVVLTKDDDNRQTFERTKAAAAGAETLPGVGDSAYVRGSQAFVLKGDTIAVIVVNLKRPAPAVAEVARKLAGTAAGRL